MHLIQTRKKLVFVFITIVEHCSDDTISKNSRNSLETIEFENGQFVLIRYDIIVLRLNLRVVYVKNLSRNG